MYRIGIIVSCAVVAGAICSGIFLHETTPTGGASTYLAHATADPGTDPGPDADISGPEDTDSDNGPAPASPQGDTVLTSDNDEV